MKNIASKGQGSLEYMMTYAWAIIIMGIVGVFIWQSGIFNQSCPPGQSGFSQVRPMDWVVSETGDKITISFINDAGMSLQYVSLNASIYSDQCDSIDFATVYPPAESWATVRSGEVRQIEFRPADYNCEIPARGSCYQIDLTLAYVNPVSTISHNSVGQLRGTVE